MSFEWIKSIPDFIKYFNDDHQLIISLIGIDSYIKLYEYFGKTGVYFPIHRFEDNLEDDKQMIIKLIGEQKYDVLLKSFSKSVIYFSSSPIVALKKAWVNKNKHVDYKLAARTLDTSIMTIYKWRAEFLGVTE